MKVGRFFFGGGVAWVCSSVAVGVFVCVSRWLLFFGVGYAATPYSGRAQSTPKARTRQGRNPETAGVGTRGRGDQKGGSRPPRTAPEGRHDHAPDQRTGKRASPKPAAIIRRFPRLRGLGSHPARGGAPRCRMPKGGRVATASGAGWRAEIAAAGGNGRLLRGKADDETACYIRRADGARVARARRRG